MALHAGWSNQQNCTGTSSGQVSPPEHACLSVSADNSIGMLVKHKKSLGLLHLRNRQHSLYRQNWPTRLAFFASRFQAPDRKYYTLHCFA